MLEITPARVTSVSIYGQATGSIGTTLIQNATGQLQTSWTSTGTPLTDQSVNAKNGLVAGTYRLTATDDVGPASINYVVSQNRPLRIYPGAVTDVEIFGQKTGAIARTSVSGGDNTYTPYWSSLVYDMSNDHSLQSKSSLYAGDYTVRIIDGVGAETHYAYTVSQTQQLEIHGGVYKNATVNGLSGGSISPCRVTGGVLPYLYMWQSSVGVTPSMSPIVLDAYDQYTIPELSELRPGLYKLVVTDALGAVAERTFPINEGPNRIYHLYGSSRNRISNFD